MLQKLHWIILIATVAALFAGPTAGYAQGRSPQVRVTQVDNSKFPQVTVYVSVTNAAGEPVAVDPATIQLSENGEVMHPTHVGAGSEGGIGPLNTMLVMDVSGSMDKNGKIDGAKDAAKAYVEQMRPGDQTGLMVYNTKAKYVQPLTSDTNVLLSAIDSIQTGGNTSMYDALVVAEQDLQAVSGRKAIIALTDGLDNHSTHTADDVINGIGAGGLSISTIGLGDSTTKAQSGLDVPALTSLSQRAGGVYSFAGDPQSLSALFQQYGRALQNEYAVTYVSPNALRDGVNRSLSVALVGTAASTTSAYNPGGVLPEVASQSWLLFVLILLGLVALLLAPAVISWISGGVGGKRRKSRIRLVGSGNGPTSSTSSMARGRIKLK
jgi:VWFA-related protein